MIEVPFFVPFVEDLREVLSFSIPSKMGNFCGGACKDASTEPGTQPSDAGHVYTRRSSSSLRASEIGGQSGKLCFVSYHACVHRRCLCKLRPR